MAAKKRLRQPSGNELIPPTLDGLTRLLDDLHGIRDEHSELYHQVYELIGWLLTAQGFIWNGRYKQSNKEATRHAVVRSKLECGDKWDDVFESASTELKDHPAAAGARAMRESYQDIEKELPTESRRPRTYRRRR